MHQALLLIAAAIATAHDRWRLGVARRRSLSGKIAALEERVARLEAEGDLLTVPLPPPPQHPSPPLPPPRADGHPVARGAVPAQRRGYRSHLRTQRADSPQLATCDEPEGPAPPAVPGRSPGSGSRARPQAQGRVAAVGHPEDRRPTRAHGRQGLPVERPADPASRSPEAGGTRGHERSHRPRAPREAPRPHLDDRLHEGRRRRTPALDRRRHRRILPQRARRGRRPRGAERRLRRTTPARGRPPQRRTAVARHRQGPCSTRWCRAGPPDAPRHPPALRRRRATRLHCADRANMAFAQDRVRPAPPSSIARPAHWKCASEGGSAGSTPSVRIRDCSSVRPTTSIASDDHARCTT